MKIALSITATILINFIALSAGAAFSQTSTVIAVDGRDNGRRFDGIGALSAGGSSALLWNYPKKDRDEILDYLFKPHFGASLQILKVEIGGDMNSTSGAEGSHMRTPTDSNYNRGYEWWLMEEAKKRNPNIKLYGLEWGAPGWFKGGFWSEDNINYIISWIKHAQSDHDLHIDYIGGWNESGWDMKWFENLKRALKSNGLTTQIVGTDNYWNVVDSLKKYAAFKSVINIVGIHYPSGSPSRLIYPDDSVAGSLDMPIWTSEGGSQNYDCGALALARGLNREYIDSRITAMINWSVVCAWYPDLPYWGAGLMLADEPWSGHYAVGKSIWAVAQTTQFTEPGWRYMDGACGYLGGNRLNGSYVALKSPDGRDYSVIIETVDAASPQSVTLKINGGLSTGEVHVWATVLSSGDPDQRLLKIKDIKPDSGKYTLELRQGCVYSITTTTGQHRGIALSPPSAVMPLPFTQDFNECTLGSIPRYFDSIQGAFDVDSSGGGRKGRCLRQEITRVPILWHWGSPTPPLVVVGDTRWADYSVSVDVLLEEHGHLDLIGRLNKQSQTSGASQGYHLRINSDGGWSLFKENIQAEDTVMASGKMNAGLNTWHRLTLSFLGNGIKAFIDSSLVAAVSDSSYSSGQVGFLVGGWEHAEFDNVSVVSSTKP